MSALQVTRPCLGLTPDPKHFSGPVQMFYALDFSGLLNSSLLYLIFAIFNCVLR